MTTGPVVGVLGGANIDYVVRVTELPAPGATVVGSDVVLLPGGKGANQACAASRLGAETHFVAAVGTDHGGDLALNALHHWGVNTSLVRRVEAPTGSAFITVDDQGENTIVVAPGANQHLVIEPSTLAHCDVLLSQLETRPDAVFDVIRTSAVPFVLNAAPAQVVPSDVLAKCRVVIVNEVEAAQIDLAQCAMAVTTLGAAGAVLYERGVEVARATPPNVNVVDTVGAGDVFCAAFAVRLAAGDNPGDALRYAVVASALATTAVGAQGCLPTDEEVRQCLADA